MNSKRTSLKTSFQTLVILLLETMLSESQCGAVLGHGTDDALAACRGLVVRRKGDCCSWLP